MNGVLQADSEDATHRVYGGYGYVASSEAEAYEALRFGCGEDHRRSYFEVACRQTTGAVDPAPSVVSDAMRAVVLQDLQRHEAEFRIMQGNALGLGASALSTPSCLAPDSMLAALPTQLPSSVPYTSTIAAMAEPERSRLNRYRVAVSPLMADEMIRAILFEDQMHAQIQGSCRSASAVTSFCQDVRSQRDRIRDSFPALFNSVADLQTSELRSALHELLGSRFDAAATPAARERRGRALYQAAVRSSGVDSLSELERRISTAIRDAATNPPESSPGSAASSPSPASAALARINRALRDVRAQESARTAQALSEVCARRGPDDYLRSAPNIVRQMLNDATPERRAMARLVLCESTALPRNGRRTSCEGVSGAPPSGGASRGVRVERFDWSFPFGSNLNYTLREPSRPPADAPYDVETTITVRADRTLSATLKSRLG